MFAGYLLPVDLTATNNVARLQCNNTCGRQQHGNFRFGIVASLQERGAGQASAHRPLRNHRQGVKTAMARGCIFN